MADGDGSLKAAESALRQAGFTVSEICRSRPSCFDLAARKNESIIFIKVQSNIGRFSTNDSAELQAISDSFSAPCLLIGEQVREKPIHDDTVYTRHNVIAVTSKTFENVVLHDVRPLIQATPGGYYVEVDGESLKHRRQELGLSAGEIAEMIKTSRRTLYGYEKGMTMASVTTAYNLIWALGIPAAKSVDILERRRNQRKSCVLRTARLMLAKNRILKKLFRKCVRYNVVAVRKAPFDFVLNDPEKNIRIVGAVANPKELNLDNRLDEMMSISKVTQAHPVLITEAWQPERDIACINNEDISRMRNGEELIASLK